MLPKIGTDLPGLPPDLRFVRGLEQFEGPILSEYRLGSSFYVEKYCTSEGSLVRYLLVRSEQRSIAEFLAGKLSMLDLLTEATDRIGMLIDKQGSAVQQVTAVSVDVLPRGYLPTATRFHDEDLRPEWDIVPQSYLLDEDWDARGVAGLAVIERHYFNAAAFAYHTKPDAPDRLFPEGVLGIDYEGGYSVMHAFNAMRQTVPKHARSTTEVAAASPGVITVKAPAETATRLASALRALSPSVDLYRAVHSWSRLSPEDADSVPEDARDDTAALCKALDVDENRLYPKTYDEEFENFVTLVAGKLIAAYYRVLLRVLSPIKEAEFMGVKLDEQPAIDAADTQEEEAERIMIKR